MVVVRPVDDVEQDQPFTRRSFILGIANKEGGAHVDPEPASGWRSLWEETYTGAFFTPGSDSPIGNLVPASVRQIGWEMLDTLDDVIEGSGTVTEGS